MPRFLIEVEHDATVLGCARDVDVFFKTGSHFFTHADWGCKDGVHKGWFVVELGSKDEARSILPTAFRRDAKIVQLNSFSVEEIDSILRSHKP